MARRIAYKGRELPLTVQLSAALVAGGLLLAWIVALIGADLLSQEHAREQHSRELTLCQDLASRAAPLLDHSDDLRLAVLAASTADLGKCRVLMVDKTGLVRLDTGLSLGGKRLQQESADGPVQRQIPGGFWEVIAPALSNRGNAGEVRIRYPSPELFNAGFPWSLFGIAFLTSLSLAIMASWIGHQQVLRIRRATEQAYRLSRGEASVVVEAGAVGGLRELHHALEQLDAVTEKWQAEVEEGFLELAKQLLRSLEQRGCIPRGHGERTRRYAITLAERLGLDPASKRELAIAALLIDLGKVGVRPSALSKVGRLSEVERESLRQYPLRSAHLLAGLPGLRGAARIVRHHHEKYDGSGYPEGLRGERIPVRSRILAIADAYDLLTSMGPQGDAMSWPEALDRMHEDRGEHFDPDLLDLFEEEIRKAPTPTNRQSRVLISSAGVVPYKLAEEPSSGWIEEQEDPENLLAYGEEELELYGDSAEEQSG